MTTPFTFNHVIGGQRTPSHPYGVGGGSGPEKPLTPWQWAGIIAGVLTAVSVIVLCAFGSQAFQKEQNGYKAAWDRGEHHPAPAAVLVRGNTVPTVIPQSIDSVSSWWDYCVGNHCSNASIGHYPDALDVGALRVGTRDCKTVEAGSHAQRVMIASNHTPGRSYTAVFTGNGNLTICSQQTSGANDKIVVWNA